MRERLDKLLVDRGLARSRERAQALILAGDVLVGDVPVTKAGAQVDVAAPLRLRGPDHPYVSRGALKLVGALDAFGVTPAGAVCADVGASTGGFTDVLLRRGAARVYAIDVGYGLLDARLRGDPRVVVVERTNVRTLDPARIPEPCALATIDVSFISLRLVLPVVARLLGDGGRALAMVKPQFEVGRGQVGKGGVVRDEDARRAAVDGVAAAAEADGWRVLDRADSPLRGPRGNLETFLLLARG